MNTVEYDGIKCSSAHVVDVLHTALLLVVLLQRTVAVKFPATLKSNRGLRRLKSVNSERKC